MTEEVTMTVDTKEWVGHQCEVCGQFHAKRDDGLVEACVLFSDREFEVLRAVAHSLDISVGEFLVRSASELAERFQKTGR
jgi:hypothetical protein